MATTDFFLHMTAGSRFPPHLTLNLTSLCNDEAFFEAFPKYRVINSTCTISYSLNKASSHSVNANNFVFNSSSNVFRVPLERALHSKTLYSVVLKCLKDDDGTLQYSKLVDKFTGECHRYRLLTTTGSEVIYKEQAVFSSSVQDIVLGVVFSVVALLIVFVTIHYQYKRYRRQRRMQQYLSTPHTDPFERLQDHMEE
ncbi:uncharacterized protein LOC125668520 isoform X2 [Ostrea edulis]|uniref:uncharacterized protein LOC125668520 isoform X2 n=1 Tax=Ostrea edulis TaxID=37623 RepID=UPI0024AFC58B|nr:uncharacterized protein LOC125668520 isoform X2 [Ostrea edulis]